MVLVLASRYSRTITSIAGAEYEYEKLKISRIRLSGFSIGATSKWVRFYGLLRATLRATVLLWPRIAW